MTSSTINPDESANLLGTKLDNVLADFYAGVKESIDEAYDFNPKHDELIITVHILLSNNEEYIDYSDSVMLALPKEQT